jgi:hypothetical protein
MTIVTSAALVATGCGRHHGGHADAPGGDDGLGLTDEGRAALDGWLAAPLKACNATSIFAPAKASDATPGIDAGWLRTRLGGRLELRTDDGTGLAVLSPGLAMGQSESSYVGEVDVDGAKSRVVAKTRSDGLRCEVLVGDAETSVAVVDIYSEVHVVEAWHAGKALPESFRIGPSRDQRFDGLGAIEGAVDRALRPDADDLAFVRGALALGAAADPLIVEGQTLDPYGDARLAYTFPSVPSLPAAKPDTGLGAGEGGVVGAPADVAALWPRAASGALAVERVHTAETFPVSSEDGVEQPTGVRRLRVSLTRKPAIAADAVDVTLTGLTPIDPRTPSAAEGLSCATARLSALRSILGVTTPGLVTGSPYPTAGSVLGACEVLRPQLVQELGTTQQGRKFFSGVFAGTTGSAERDQLHGWDDVFYDAALGALARGQTLAAGLDPAHAVALVATADASIAAIRAAAAQHPAPHVLDGTEQRLGVSWALSAETVTEAAIDRLLAAAANLDDPFADAGHKLMADAARDPNGVADDVAFALTLDDEAKDLARSAVDKAKGAHASGPVADLLLAVVQKRLDAAGWHAIHVTLDALTAFVGQERERLGGDGNAVFGPGPALDDLAPRALDEGWAEADFAALDQIALLAPLDLHCKMYEGHAAQASCIGGEALRKADGGLLAPAFAGRYAALASDLAQTIGGLDDGLDLSTRADVLRAFPEPIWADCDSAGFAAKRQSLLDALRRLPGSEFPERMHVQEEVDDALESCGA